MKVGIVANSIASDATGQTTWRIAAGCADRGHETWALSAGSFTYDIDDRIRAMAQSAPARPHGSAARYLAALRSRQAVRRWISVDELDILLLRSNPSAQKPWAQSAGINFGRLAMRRGVVVLNDPDGLAKAMNKLYLQTFPETVRPATLAEMVRPRLVEDGMFLVGLDIVGDTLLEVNVFSPGGLGSAQMFTKVDFVEPIVDALERKVRSMDDWGHALSNVDIATL